MSTTSTAIDVRQVRKAFVARDAATNRPAEFTAVADVDLTITTGEFVAIVGASGCGKTTLLNMIAGLTEPSDGELSVYGERPRCPNLDIGYMFARDALMPWRTAQQNVEASLEARPDWSRHARRERARRMLDLVGLGEATGKYRVQLSQGMRQRVSLASTLAPDPRMLLMDEPFAAVDARTRMQLQGEFLEIWESANTGTAGERKTVVFVTHDLQEATLLADRVIVMVPSPGRVAVDRHMSLPRPRANRLSEIMFDAQFRDLHHELFTALETPHGCAQDGKDGQ